MELCMWGKRMYEQDGDLELRRRSREGVIRLFVVAMYA